ncbi:MAG: helix-turn-helix domain-containing protein [Gemmatimonadetes bacterium]|nr:helix-turn-helix domain-containing protein [Gemmatimonadota bacterium]
MIVSCVADPELRRAVLRLAAPDEDVFESDPDGLSGLRHGLARCVVRETSRPEFEPVRLREGGPGEPPEIVITAGTLSRWRFDHRRGRLGADFAEAIVESLRGPFGRVPAPGLTERVFRGLERAAGVNLPAAFRGLARRVLEYPRHYGSLGALATRVGTTTGALQGRFLRRGLRSPSEHLRRLRLLAVSEGFDDAGLTVAVAADRYGYTSAGNLCRTLQNTVEKAPSDLREPVHRLELIARFAQDFLDEEAVGAWPDLEDLFYRVPPLSTRRGLSA